MYAGQPTRCQVWTAKFVILSQRCSLSKDHFTSTFARAAPGRLWGSATLRAAITITLKIIWYYRFGSMDNGCFAVAMVQRQVVLVRGNEQSKWYHRLSLTTRLYLSAQPSTRNPDVITCYMCICLSHLANEPSSFQPCHKLVFLLEIFSPYSVQVTSSHLIHREQ